MKIFIAGSDGQLAKAILEAAETAGHVTAGADIGTLDITDFKAVSEAVAGHSPDAVINCAAYNDVDGAEADWQTAFMVNGVAVRNLAHACNKTGCPLVHFSSDYVFDGMADRPYTIADRPRPISRYGESKLLGEELLKAHAERYYLIRTSWVFGMGAFSFPLKLRQWAGNKDSLRMVDDQTASPAYVGDLAAAVLKLIVTENYGLYHMTNSGHCSKYEWAEYILKLLRWQGVLEPAKSSEFNTPAQRPEYSVLDNFPLGPVLGADLPHWREATERFMMEVR